MTATLPPEVQSVFERSASTELTTIDEHGQPITWPVTARYCTGAPCIDITTDRAVQARHNRHVGLLFCAGAGSGREAAPMVLVQGTAHGERGDEIQVRPERVYVWPEGEPSAEPALYDTHMEEVRSGHSEEPEVDPAPPAGGPSEWDERLAQLGSAHPTAILSVVSPDGFPFAARVSVRVRAAEHRLELADLPAGLPLAPGRACLATEDPDAIQIRGDLIASGDGWGLVPHAVRA